MIIAGAHDATLVALSVLIAGVASYAALDLAGRARASAGKTRYAWLSAAAVAMGGGIWSMHFVAMLAFSMPGMDVHYDLELTLLSLLIAIAVTGGAFFVVSRRNAGRAALMTSGIVMGLGIAAMHYLGMAAMRMSADLSHARVWVAVAILIAIGAAAIALWLAFRRTGPVQKLVAAIVMGLAISGMHYAAMQGAVFTAHSGVDAAHGHASLAQTGVALAVATATLLILFLGLVAAMFDRRFATLAEREAAALRRSEERFRTLYRKTPLPLHSLDADGIIEQVSDAWLDLLGYRRDEVEGRPLTDFMTPASMVRHAQVDWPKLVSEGLLPEADYCFVTRGGQVRDVVMSSKVERDADGRFLRAMGGLMDVTARRQAEGALRQALKVEAIGQLTGGIAHDFNNLLAIVLGSLELLNKRLPDDPKLRSLCDNAIQGARRGSVLTQRMLAFARRQDLKPQAVDVPELVRGMTDLLQRSIGPQVRIETLFSAEVPRAHVDANQLELALLNLAVNSRDAMPGGGVITIAARPGTVAPEQGGPLKPGRYVCLSVSDTGEGMDEDVLARVQEPFFTTKGVGKGTGLGLSMVHGLAEQSGGCLVLRSRKGEGTTAEIWLPEAETASLAEAGEADGSEPETKPEDGRLTVLAVDDDALVLMSTAALLEDLGHTVVKACSGETALDLLRSGQTVDLVITDQAMPGMTGVQLVGAIRTERPQLKAILATGYAQLPPETCENLVRLGKPFDQAELARAIANCLQPHPAPKNVLPFRTRHG
ncbi:MHYT domain-containing protein [Arenibaculum pallidiluteum]|uniref:MHYT domain-containing protein n=1 Tax=Arenibaculum pallidiluteum TaxID=2812559 RepID=UPI001A9681AE|nr:MHYT domain-containing protein [Arenibaculum pallidiluteum]